MAQLQGVEVLNINELANSLKPIVLPGEVMKVFILKEGKEYNQGVAYLDDGTMLVVDNARKMIGKNIDISVTSVLQTTAGKMIFVKFDERAAVMQPRPADSRSELRKPAPAPAAVPEIPKTAQIRFFRHVGTLRPTKRDRRRRRIGRKSRESIRAPWVIPW